MGPYGREPGLRCLGNPEVGIRGFSLKISVLSKGERQNRTSEREEVVVVGGLLDPRRERKLQRKRDKERERWRYREMG